MLGLEGWGYLGTHARGNMGPAWDGANTTRISRGHFVDRDAFDGKQG